MAGKRLSCKILAEWMVILQYSALVFQDNDSKSIGVFLGATALQIAALVIN